MAPGPQRMRWWRAITLSAVGAVIVAIAIAVVVRWGPGATQAQPGPDAGPLAIAGGYFEASGIAHVPGTRQLLFVDDDRPHELFVMEVDSNGSQHGGVKALPLGTQVTDLEGITYDGRYFYVVGSQSKATGYDGDGLARFTYDTATRTTGHVESIRALKEWLSLNVAELQGTGDEPGDHVLNIEGLAWDPLGSRLLLGLRAPVVDGSALIIPIKLVDPRGAFSRENLRVDGKAIRLPLHGAGIRSIEFDEERRSFVLISGAALNEETLDFQVLEWKGDPDTASTVLATYSRTLKPEGITRAQIDGRSMRLLIFDTGRLTVID